MNTSIQSQSPMAVSRPSLPPGDARWLTSLGTYISRYSLLLFWMYSFLSVRAASIVIGVVEISVALLMALRPISPKASFFGSLGAIITFLTTVSFLFTTPGVLDHSHAVPLLGDLGGFLIKDLALLGCGVWTAAEARGSFSLS